MNRLRHFSLLRVLCSILLLIGIFYPSLSQTATSARIHTRVLNAGDRPLAAMTSFASPRGLLIGGRGHAWAARLNLAADSELFHANLGNDPRDSVNAIAETADGTIYAAGILHSKKGAFGFWAVLDASGNPARVESLPSPAYAIAIDAKQAVYIAGDGYVMKVNGWSIIPPGPVRALAIDAQGALYAAGHKPAETGVGNDAYIAELDATYERWKWTLPIGGTGGTEEVRALAIGPDGAVYAAGVTDSNAGASSVTP